MTHQPQKPFLQRLQGHARSTLIAGVLILIRRLPADLL